MSLNYRLLYSAAFNYLIAGCAIVLLPNVVSAAPKHDGGWRFTSSKDKFTDKIECNLNAPTKKVLMKFSNHKIYIVTPSAMSGDLSVVQFRIDQNPMVSTSVRVISGPLGAVEDSIQIGKIVEQAQTGKSIRLQVLAGGSIVEDQTTLTGFAPAYMQFENCIANEPPTSDD